MAEAGVAVAVVVDNTDKSGLGRVRVRYPWQRESRETYWARVAVPMAGNHRGFYFVPEVDDEVLVAFERGDLRSPYVVGSLWNSAAKPPVEDRDGRNDIRQVRTRGGHTLTFDDGVRPSVRLELSDGKRLSIADEAIVLDDGKGNGVTIQGQDGAITIRATGHLVLSGSQISIESSGTLDVSAAAALTVRGAVVRIN
jgi:uncharacterized protein involved in type VI secretion and phage assembly